MTVQFDWVDQVGDLDDMIDDPAFEIMKMRRELAELRKEVEAVRKECGNVRRGIFARFNGLANMFLECSTKLIEIEEKI